MRRLHTLFLAGALTFAAGAYAHHSFAVYFDSDKVISINGVVSNFAFKNPHGIIVLSVKNKQGVTEDWKAETNSPSLLARRGWTKDIIKAGETVTIEGWPARNGANLIRIRKVTRANGEAVGTAAESTEQK